jgi:tRNA dimethylallyltransferase
MALAERLPIEVVSADSRAVYRWMDIGTAKPSVEERQRVPHHLIDVIDPDQSYSLALYQEQSLAAIGEIAARGRLPVVVGGAGLYVSAICHGLSLPDVPPDLEYRQSLEGRAQKEGWQVLLQELELVDPVTAARIDPKNVRRVIRALEVFRATGKPFSTWQTPLDHPPVTCVVTIGLNLERAELYAQIDRRIDAWIDAGFVDEVRGLLARGYSPGLPSMSGIGYREIAQFLGGSLKLSEAVARLRHATHAYARRQLTWFRRDQRITWLDAQTATASDVLDLLG